MLRDRVPERGGLLRPEGQPAADEFGIVIGTSTVVAMMSLTEGLRVRMTGDLAFLGAGLFSQVVGYFAVGYALGHLPASIVAPSMIAQPVITSPLAIAGLGLLINERAPTVVIRQKAVEMGASRLAPVITRHTQVARVNLERMRANAIEAAQQCGILSLPEVAEPAPLAAAVADSGRLLVFCDERAEVRVQLVGEGNLALDYRLAPRSHPDRHTVARPAHLDGLGRRGGAAPAARLHPRRGEVHLAHRQRHPPLLPAVGASPPVRAWSAGS